MTSKQFRAALDKLDLSQRFFARKILGISERTVRTWALGESAVPSAIAIIVKLMLAGKITADDVKDVAGA